MASALCINPPSFLYELWPGAEINQRSDLLPSSTSCHRNLSVGFSRHKIIASASNKSQGKTNTRDCGFAQQASQIDLSKPFNHQERSTCTSRSRNHCAAPALPSDNVVLEEENASDSDEEGLARKEFQFVNWFREAWPYIQGHRGSTFVLVLPGEVIARRDVAASILQDVALLHGLGVRLVIVPGTYTQIDQLLSERGLEGRFHGAYRLTDAECLEAAMEAAGRIRVDIEAKLSRGPSIPVLRRHGETDKWHDVGISVASGNFVAAKRRGVVDGVDFGATGEVKKVDVARIRERLADNCIVLLSNLGYSAAGEVLNCNTYEVATACATALQADKLLLMLNGPVLDARGRLLRWMDLQESDRLIRERASQSYTAKDYVRAVAGADYVKALGLASSSSTSTSSPSSQGGEVAMGDVIEGNAALHSAAAAAAGPGGSGGSPAAGAGGSGIEGDNAVWGASAGPEAGVPIRSSARDDDEAESRARWNAQRALYSMPYQSSSSTRVSISTSGSGSGSSDSSNGARAQAQAQASPSSSSSSSSQSHSYSSPLPTPFSSSFSSSSSGGNGSLHSPRISPESLRPGGAYEIGGGHVNGTGSKSTGPKVGFAIGGEERSSRTYGYLSELTAAVYACRHGVRRVHLLDSSLEGALLLELYTRDGIGTMISSDLYEGTRAAQATDVEGISGLLQPLEEAGVLVHRSAKQLMKELPYFTVVERDGSLIACAALFPFPAEKCGEVAAFAVSPEARGHGRGDNLLDYLEKRAREMGLEQLFLLTTRTADWFMQRGFAPCSLEALPSERQKRIDRSRGSKSFIKNVQEPSEENKVSLGKGLPAGASFGPTTS